MKNEIGIGILDIYSDEDLTKCLSSIPDDMKNNVVIVSNKLKASNNSDRIYDSEVSFATLRNYLLTQLRIKGFKYYFLLNSNTSIKNKNIFEKTIKLANIFGTWFITGPTLDKNVALEDDSTNLTLNLNPSLNTNFVFLYSGIIKNFGFFDERYYNTRNLDILDYILKLREKKVYPPNHYNATIDVEDIEESTSEIQKINFKDMESFDTKKQGWDKSVELSFAYFYHKHKYIPTQNDPAGVTQEVLLNFMEELQQKYGSKE